MTIINIDGVVLADTLEDSNARGNFAGRAEFKNALRFGASKGAYVSAATGEKEFYAAVPIRLDDDNVGVALVTVPTSQFQSDIDRIVFTIAFAALIVSFLSVGLGYFLARAAPHALLYLSQRAHAVSLKAI